MKKVAFVIHKYKTGNVKALQVDFILPCNPYIGLLTKITAKICTTMLEHPQ